MFPRRGATLGVPSAEWFLNRASNRSYTEPTLRAAGHSELTSILALGGVALRLSPQHRVFVSLDGFGKKMGMVWAGLMPVDSLGSLSGL